jgi:hypothetical protein
VHWAEDDPDGHPVLVVHLHAALQQDKAAAQSAAEAILAHMEAALETRLSDDPGCPEQLVVVLDSRGAPTFQVSLWASRSFLLLFQRRYLSRNGYVFEEDCLCERLCDVTTCSPAEAVVEWSVQCTHVLVLKMTRQAGDIQCPVSMVSCSSGGWCGRFRISPLH